MTKYVVFAFIPYENESEVMNGTLEEVKAFIKSPNRGYPLDDLSIYSLDAPDVYELFNG